MSEMVSDVAVKTRGFDDGCDVVCGCSKGGEQLILFARGVDA